MHKNLQKTLSVVAASAGALALVAVGSTSSMAQAPDVFSVTTLSTSNVVAVDANALAGDDDGFLGVTGTKFLFGGDFATIAYDLADLGNPYTTDISNATQQNNWLFSDLKTQTSYLFEAADNVVSGFDISGIQPLDQTGDISGAVIPLSIVISIDNSVDNCTIFASGYGRAAIWDGCLGVIYDIELPSGVVTTIVGAATFATYDSTVPLLLDYYEVENGVSQGVVVEYDGTNLRFVAVAENVDENPLGIYRYDAQAQVADPVEILSFQGDEPDLWKFTISPATNQWCAGIEGGWDVIDPDIDDELAFCAGATFSTTVTPALANTGVDTSGYLVAGAAVLLAGAAMVLVARRRTARG